MILVFLGKAGTGKGTQAQLLAKDSGMLHASMGDILREELAKKSALGKKIEKIVKSGQLVPDEIAVELIDGWIERIPDLKKEIIFDGFPRTWEQAERFEEILEKNNLKIDLALNFLVPEKALIERLSTRRTCKTCRKVYNVQTSPPKKEGICDLDNGELYQRDDDKEPAIRKRFKIYDEQIKPILEHYKGKLIEIDAQPPIEEVFKQVKKIVEKQT